MGAGTGLFRIFRGRDLAAAHQIGDLGAVMRVPARACPRREVAGLREVLGGVNAILTQVTNGVRTNSGETLRGAALGDLLSGAGGNDALQGLGVAQGVVAACGAEAACLIEARGEHAIRYFAVDRKSVV